MKTGTIGLSGLSVLLAATLAACTSNEHLVVGGDGSGGGIGTDSGVTDSGDNNTEGGPPGGGSGGATVTRLQHPLPIPATEALTRMANVLWQAAPDSDLMQQAAAGHFQTIEDLYGPARQMLADTRAAQGVGAFYDWWLNLPAITKQTKDATLFPDYTAALQADMRNEALTFGTRVTLDMSGSYATLLTAPFSFINARLAAIYGVSGVTGDDLQQVNLNSPDRAGLMTMPVLQALTSTSTRTSAVDHGVYIDERFYCLQVPAPPPNFPPLTIPAGTTQRNALASDEVEPACRACHVLIDDLGLAFESFDAIGRARTTDNGQPVDVSNLTAQLDSMPFNFSGPYALARYTAASNQAETCMARQWLAFALKKNVWDVADTATAQAMPAFIASNFNLKELIAAVLLTDAFLAP